MYRTRLRCLCAVDVTECKNSNANAKANANVQMRLQIMHVATVHTVASNAVCKSVINTCIYLSILSDDPEIRIELCTVQ